MDLIGYDGMGEEIMIKDNNQFAQNVDLQLDRRLGGYNQSIFSASVPRGTNHDFIESFRYNSGNN